MAGEIISTEELFANQPETVSTEELFGDALPKRTTPLSMREKFEVVKTLPVSRFIQGLGRGVTFQNKEETILPRSFEGLGEKVGSALPVAGAMAAGSLAAPALATLGGTGLATLGGAALGGATFGAMEGASKNLPVPETLENMGTYAVMFPAMEIGVKGAGKGVKYLRSLFGNFGDTLSNFFYNTPQKVAENLGNKGKSSFGVQAMEQTSGGVPRGYSEDELAQIARQGELPKKMGWSRKAVFNRAKLELSNLENKIQERLDSIRQKQVTPNVPDTGVKGIPQLEYRPSPTTEINPGAQSSGAPIRLRHGEQLPPGQVLERPETIGVNYMDKPIYKLKSDGTLVPVEPTQADALGVPVRQPMQDISGTLSPNVEMGTIREAPLGVSVKRGQSIIEPSIPEMTLPELGVSRSGLGQARRSLKQPEGFGFKTNGQYAVEKGQVAEPQVINNVVDDILGRYEPYELDRGQVQLLQRIKSGDAISMHDLNQFRRILDDESGKAHLNVEHSSKIDAFIRLGNKLRSIIAEFDPKLAEFYQKQHLNLTIVQGLGKTPQVAKAGQGYSGLWRFLQQEALGSAPTHGIARGLNYVRNKPVSPSLVFGAENLGKSVILNRERFEEARKKHLESKPSNQRK